MDERKNRSLIEQGWEHALREKLEGFEYPVGEMPPLVLPSNQRSNKGVVSPWWVVTATVAASLLLALLKPQNSAPDVIIPTLQDTGMLAELSDEESPLNHTLLVREHDFSEKTQVYLAPQEEVVDVSPNKIAEVGEQYFEESAEDVVSEDSEPKSEESNSLPELEEKSVIIAPAQKEWKRKGIAVAINVSGMPEKNDGVQPESMIGHFLIQEIDMYSSSEESDYTVREKLPIEVGATAIIPIAPRLSLEGGVRYSLRRLEVSRGGYFSPEQYELDVHQVGIPLGIQYELAQFNRIGINMSTGILPNIPVATVVRGHQREEQKAGFSLDSYMTIGTDFRVSKLVALSASIGGSYDIVPLNQQLFEKPSSRLRLRMNLGLKFRIE